MFSYKFPALIAAFALFLSANQDSYIFEAKGEFAKELKALVEKYSAEQNLSINVYENAPSEQNSRFLNIGVDSNAKFNASLGASLYAKKCASCHGENGEKRAHGVSKRLKDLSANDIEAAFSGYTSDPEFGGRLRDLMRPVASMTSYKDLGAIIAYLKGSNALKESTNSNTDISTTPSQGSYLK